MKLFVAHLGVETASSFLCLHVSNILQDIGGKAKDFNNLSGKYTMELIVGDAVIENPISWIMVYKVLVSYDYRLNRIN
jgi:hypothetical protein